MSIEISFLDAISEIPAYLKFLNSNMSESKKHDDVIQVSKQGE